jgi:uncharacterized protein (DUF2235 family)
MQRNVVICLDGTWNTPGKSLAASEDTSTNVFKFYERALSQSESGKEQIKWYNNGIGTEYLNRISGGAFGLGLDKHIMDAYTFLIENHRDGDSIYILGFSRGAYTARSLVGLIRNCGLLRMSDKTLIERAYAIYRSREEVDSEHAVAFRSANSRSININFLGLWDTVGALGIPLQSFKEFNSEQYAFHNTRLSGIVQNAFHALAVDEHRLPYAATIWDAQDYKDRARGQVVQQLWFTGAHADIGGGYKDDHPIADVSLRWIQKKSADCGLGVALVPLPALEACTKRSLHDSYKAFLGGAYAIFSRRHYRPIGTAGGSEALDLSVTARLQNSVEYRPKNSGLDEVSSTKDAWI